MTNAFACSFCGKDEENACKLVRGTCGSICDECVALTANIVWNHYQTGIDVLRNKQKRLEQLSLSTVAE